MRASVPEQGSLIEANSQHYELENRLDNERGQQRNQRVPEERGVLCVRVLQSTTVPRDEGVSKGEACRLRHLGEQLVGDIVRLELHLLLRTGCRVLGVFLFG